MINNNKRFQRIQHSFRITLVAGLMIFAIAMIARHSTSKQPFGEVSNSDISLVVAGSLLMVCSLAVLRWQILFFPIVMCFSYAGVAWRSFFWAIISGKFGYQAFGWHSSKKYAVFTLGCGIFFVILLIVRRKLAWTRANMWMLGSFISLSVFAWLQWQQIVGSMRLDSRVDHLYDIMCRISGSFTDVFFGIAMITLLLEQPRRLLGSCVLCGYSMAGLPASTRCPECGFLEAG